MKPSSLRFSLPSLSFAFLALLTSPGSLVAQTWNIDSNGAYNNSANWSPASVPNSEGAGAVFGSVITANRTITVDGNFTLGSILFDDNNSYTLAATTGNAITLNATGNGTASITVTNAGGNHTIGASLIFSGDPVVIAVNSTGGASPLTISGNLTGTGNLIKTGAGNLTLSGASNSFAGSILLSGGLVRISNDSQLGDASNGVTLDGGGLSFTANVTSNRAFTIGGAGGVFDQANSSVITLGTASSLSGSGALAKTGGNGTLTINSANNTYNGTLTVQNGTLTLNATQAVNGTVLAGTGNTTINYNADAAAGSGTVFASAAKSQIVLGSGVASFGNGSFSVGSGAALVGNAAQFALLDRNTNLSLAAGSILAGTQDGANHAVQNLGTNRDLFFGVGGAYSETGNTIFVGSTVGATPWRGISTGVGANGNLQTANITAFSNFVLQGANGRVLTLGNGGSAGGITMNASSPVSASVVGSVTLSDNANSFTNVTFSVPAGSILTLTGIGSGNGVLGSPGATANVTLANGTLNIGASAVGAPVVNAGSVITMGGAGGLTGNIVFTPNGSNFGTINATAGSITLTAAGSSNNGTISLASGATLTLGNATNNDRGVNTGAINVNAGGILTANGSGNLAVPTYQGSITVAPGGIVQIKNAAALSGSTNTLNAALTGVNGSGAIVRMSVNDIAGIHQVNPAAIYTIQGADRSQAAGINLNGGVLTNDGNNRTLTAAGGTQVRINGPSTLSSSSRRILTVNAPVLAGGNTTFIGRVTSIEGRQQFGTVVLANTTNAFTGQVYVMGATTSNSAATLQIQHNGTASTLGTATVNLGDGTANVSARPTLQLRSNSTATFANDLVVRNTGNVSVDRIGGSSTHQTLGIRNATFNNGHNLFVAGNNTTGFSLAIGNATFAGGNTLTYLHANSPSNPHTIGVGGTVQLDGSATILTNVYGQGNTTHLTIGTLSGNGMLTLGLANANATISNLDVTLGSSAVGYNGGVNVFGGILRYNAPYAAGNSTMFAGGTAPTQVELTPATGTNTFGSFQLDGSGAISGNLAQLGSLIRLKNDFSNFANATLYTSVGAMVSQTEAGANNALQDNDPDGSLFFGLSGDMSENMTLGASGGTTPWGGLSSDALANRTLISGTITAAGDAGQNVDYFLRGFGDKSLILGSGNVGSVDVVLGNNSTSSTAIIQGNVVLNSGNNNFSNSTLSIAAGGTLRINELAPDGSIAYSPYLLINPGGIFDANAPADPFLGGYNNTILDIALGTVVLSNGQALVGPVNGLRDALEGVGLITITIDNLVGLSNLSQTAAYVIAGGTNTQAETFNLNGGLVTNDNTNRTLTGNGGVTLNGPATLAATSNRVFTISSPLNAGANTVTIGSDLNLGGLNKFGTVILNNTSNVTANNLTGNIVILNGATLRADFAAANGTSPIGSAAIVLGGGGNLTANASLQLRGNGTASNGTIVLGNDLSMAGANRAQISVDRVGGSTSNNTFVLGNLTSAQGQLSIVGGNGYDLQLGQLGLAGDLVLHLNPLGTALTVGSIDGGGSPRVLTKTGNTSVLTVNGAATGNLSGTANITNGTLTLNAGGALGAMDILLGASANSTLNLNAVAAAGGSIAGSGNGVVTINYNADNAAGDNAISVSTSGSQINIGSGVSSIGGDTFQLAGAGTVLSGGNASFSQLVFGTNLTAVAGVIIAGTDPVANNNIGNITGASGLIYGLGSNLATLNITLGTGSPWSGLSTDAVGNRTLLTGNLTTLSDIALIGFGGRTLTLGNGFTSGGVEFNAPAPITARISGNVSLADDRNRFSNLTFNVTGSGNRLSLASSNSFGLGPLPSATIGANGTLAATAGGSINEGMEVTGLDGSSILLSAGANLGNITTTGRVEFQANAVAANLGLITVNAGGLVLTNSSSTNAGTITLNTRGVLDISSGAPNFNQGTINVNSGGEVIVRNGLALNAGSINLGTSGVLSINTAGLNGAAPIVRGNGSITVQLGDANALGGTQFTAASVLPGDSIRLAADNVVGFEAFTPTNVIIVGTRTQNTGIVLAGGMLTGGNFLNSNQSFTAATLNNGTGTVDFGATGGSIGAPSFVAGNITNLGTFTVNEEIVSSGPLVFGSVSPVDNYERQGQLFLNGSLQGVTGNITQAAGITTVAARLDNITNLAITGGRLNITGAANFTLSGPISISNGTLSLTSGPKDNAFVADFNVGTGGELAWNWDPDNDGVFDNYLGDAENDITLSEGGRLALSSQRLATSALASTRTLTLGGGIGEISIGTLAVGGLQTLQIAGNGQLLGNGTLLKTGDGIVEISGNNSGTYTGGAAIVNAGTLVLSNPFALGATNPTLTVNAGTLNLNADGLSLDNLTVGGGTLRLSGNVTGSLSGILSGILEFNNVPSISPVTFNGSVAGPPAITTGLRGLTAGGVYGGDIVLLGLSTLDAQSASYAVTGNVSQNGTGTLRKTGINTVTLGGNNTFTGNLSIEQGIASFSTPDALPDGGALVNVLAANAGVGFGYDAGFIPSQIEFDGNLTTPGSAGVFAIDTANWTSSLDLSASPLRLGSTANGTIGANVTITPNSVANNYFFGGGGGNLTVLSSLGGSAGLEMGTSGNLASGRVILAANNTFTGMVSVRSGSLALGASGAVAGASALLTNGSVTTSFNGSTSGYTFGSLLLDPAITYSGVAAATGNAATGAILNGGAIGWSANRTLTQLPGIFGNTVLSTLANPTVPTATYLLHLGGPDSAGNLTLSGFSISNQVSGNVTTPVALVKSGVNSLLDLRSLSSSNYTGGLSILEGTVLVDDANQLGTGRVFIDFNNSTLAVAANLNVANPIRARGDRFGNSGLYSTIDVAPGRTATFNGLADGGTFQKTGNGTLRFLPTSTPPLGTQWGLRILAGNFNFSAPPSTTTSGAAPTSFSLEVGNGTASSVRVRYQSVFGVDVPQNRSGFGRFQSNSNSNLDLTVDTGKVLRFFNQGVGSQINGNVTKLGLGGVLFGGTSAGTPGSGSGTVNIRSGTVQWGGLAVTSDSGQDPSMPEVIVKVQGGGTAQWANLSGTLRTHTAPLFINDENLGGSARIAGLPHAGNVSWNGPLSIGGGYSGLEGSSRPVGTVTFFNPGVSHTVAVTLGSELYIEAGATFNAGGSKDTFTDEIDPTIHVNVSDNSGTLGITAGIKHVDGLQGPGVLDITGNATLRVGSDFYTDFAQGAVNITNGTLTNDWGGNATGSLTVAGDMLLGDPAATPLPAAGNLYITDSVTAANLNLRRGVVSVGNLLGVDGTLTVGTATDAGNVTASAVTLNVGQFHNGTLTAASLTGTGAAPTFTQASAGNLTISGAVTAFDTLTLNGIASVGSISTTSSATVGATGNLSASTISVSTLEVNGVAAITGSGNSLTPNLSLGSNSTLTQSGPGTLLINSTFTAGPGATININNGTVDFAAGGGSSNVLVNVAASGTALINNASLLPNTVTLNGGLLVGLGNSSVANNLVSNNGTLTVGTNGTLVLPNTLAGTNLLKNGAGTLELQGNNTLAGNITIDLGTLLLTDPTQLAGGIVVNGNGTLAGSGTVAGDIFNNGGVVSIGTSPGLISAGSFTQTAAGTLNIEINGSPSNPTLWDRLVAAGGAVLDGILNIVFDNTLVTAFNDTWTFLTSTGGNRTGNFSTVNITAPGNLTAADFAVEYGANYVQVRRTSNDNVTYDSWKLTYWPSPDPNDDWNDDPDLDGHINLLEYAFATDPLVPSDLPVSVAESGGNLTASYTRPGGINFRSDIVYKVNRTLDLVTPSLLNTDTPANTDSDPTLITVASPVAYGTVDREFLDVQIEFTSPPAP